MTTATIAERIADSVKTALLAGPQIDTVADRIERAREDAYTRDDVKTGAINIRSKDESTKRHSQDIDDNELDIDIEINVRADNQWETPADAIAAQVHARVRGYDYAGASLKIAQISKTGRSPSGDSGDYTPGQITLTYTFRYLTMAGDITAQP